MSRFLILRQANLKYDEWERLGRRHGDQAALEALELYREFHSKATDPFTRAFCAAFNASYDTRTTTKAEREKLVETAGYTNQVHTQAFFDFLGFVARVSRGVKA